MDLNYALLTLIVIILVLMIVLIYKITKAPLVTDKEYKKTLRLDAIMRVVKDEIEAQCNEDLRNSSFAMLSQSDLDNRERLREELRKCSLECATGDPNQREYMKDKIGDVIQKYCGITKENISKVIHFNDSEKMSAQDKFELMYARYKRTNPSYTFKYMEEDFHFFDPKTGADGRTYYEVTAEDVEAAYDKFNLDVEFVDKLECLRQRVYQTLYGHHVADIFTSDYSFDDVEGGVGGRLRDDFNYHEEIRAQQEDEVETDRIRERNMYYDVLSVKYSGKLARMSFMSFGTPETLSRVVDQIYLNNPKDVLCELTPKVQSKLKDPGESRIMVVCPPEANKSFYVRHPASNKRLSLDVLITWKGCEIVKKLLIDLVLGEFNLFITGNTGGGKTTLLKTLMEFLDPSYEIRTIESEAELNGNNIYPKKNVHALVESQSRDIYQCIEDTKKMNTDVMIIGEVNSPRLAGAAVQSGQSGSTMCMTTMHLNSTDKCFAYMRNALINEMGITDVRVASQQVIDTFNFDIRQVHDKDGNRYIEHISEVVPVEYDEYSDDPVENEKEYHERVTDRKLYRVNRIIEFDKFNMEYHVVGNLSPKSLEKLVSKIGLEKTKEIKRELDRLKVEPINYGKLLEESLEDSDGSASDEDFVSSEYVAG